MRNIVLAFTCLAIALWAQDARAQAFDPNQCARIQDVDVPYEVATAEDAITFSSRGGDIVVSAQSIRANGDTHTSPAVADYHQKLTQFLSQSEIMGRTMNPLARHDVGMGDAATGMCQAILDLARSAAVIEGEFRGYSSPVRIRLR